MSWDWKKNPPDILISIGFDRLVLWLHNIGIPRKWVLRSYVAALILLATTLEGIKQNYWMIPLDALVLAGFVVFEEWRLHTYGMRLYNVLNEEARQGSKGWIRLAFILMILSITFKNMPFNFDSPLWAINLWLIYTLVPADPPKRKFKETLRAISPITLSPAPSPA